MKTASRPPAPQSAYRVRGTRRRTLRYQPVRLSWELLYGRVTLHSRDFQRRGSYGAATLFVEGERCRVQLRSVRPDGVPIWFTVDGYFIPRELIQTVDEILLAAWERGKG